MTAWPVLTTLVGIVAALGFARGRALPTLSPFTVGMFVLVSIFGLRPLAMSTRGDYVFYGLDVSPYAPGAEFMGFIATLMFAVGGGIAAISGKTNWDGLARESERRDTQVQLPWSIGPWASYVLALGIVAAWFALLARAGGGTAFLRVLFAGRSELVVESLAGMPAVLFGLPVIAASLVATVRFGRELSSAYRPTERLAYWLVIAATLIPPTALGTRRFLLPSLVVAALGTMGGKPFARVPVKWIAGGVGAFLVLAAIPFVRSAGSRTGSKDFVGALSDYFGQNGVANVVDTYFLSYDTEMFDYLAILRPVVGESVPYGLGRGSVLELLNSLLPASLAPGQRWSDQVLTGIFGGACSEVVCPVPSIVGSAFIDFGWFGLIIGCAVWGYFFAMYPKLLVRSTAWRLPVLMMSGAFAAQIVRGNPVAQLAILIHSIVILLILLYVSSLLARAVQGGRRGDTRHALGSTRRKGSRKLISPDVEPTHLPNDVRPVSSSRRRLN